MLTRPIDECGKHGRDLIPAARLGRFAPALFTAGIRLRRSVLASPGCLAAGLRSHPFAGRYYTVSMWQDEASLLAFARDAEHRAAVGGITKLGPISGVLISRDADFSRPRWPEVLRWVATLEPGPYRREPTPVQHQAGIANNAAGV